MNAPAIVRDARERAGFSLRTLAWKAETSHSALSAYEAGRVVPTIDTFERIVAAAGFTVSISITPLVAPDAERSRELLAVLELAERFPATHEKAIEFPQFGHY